MSNRAPPRSQDRTGAWSACTTPSLSLDIFRSCTPSKTHRKQARVFPWNFRQPQHNLNAGVLSIRFQGLDLYALKYFKSHWHMKWGGEMPGILGRWLSIVSISSEVTRYPYLHRSFRRRRWKFRTGPACHGRCDCAVRKTTLQRFPLPSLARLK